MARHITVTKDGQRAQIRIEGVLYRKHFPRDTDPLTIRQWLLKTEVRHRTKGPAGAGQFAADAKAYLAAVKAMPTFDQRAQHIGEWIAAFGDRPRDLITPADIRAQLQTWRTVKRAVHGKTKVLSAAACNKRRTALMHLYSVLDGKSAPNPVRDVPRLQEPSAQPKGLPYETVRQILATMPASKSRARLMVMAYTGLPLSTLELVTAADVDLQGRTVSVHGRNKGRGTPGRIVPLSDDGVEAFQAMIREDAWGSTVGTRVIMRRAFRRACKRVLGSEAFTPYDLRHSFGTEVYRASGDIRATQVLMGHSTPTLTHRYTLGAVDARVNAALAQVGKKARA